MAAKSKNHDTAGHDERTQFRAFLNDEESRNIVEQVVKELVIPHASIHKGGIAGAIDYLSEHRSPKILIVDLSAIDLPLSAVNDLAEVCEPGVTVVALGDRNDVGLFRELINNGVSDYLVKPLTPALLQKSLLASVDGEQRNRQTSKLGRLICVTGSRGGVGTTMMSTALAYHIAEIRRRRVALVDLDLHFGSVALALDLEPSHGYSEALENAERIDGLYIERAMSKYSDTLYVLSGEEDLSKSFTPDPNSFEILIRELRSKFHYVILDMPRYLIRNETGLLADASNLILVTDLSLSGMRDTVRLSNKVTEENAACQVSVLANRVGEYKNAEISRSEFERGINRKLSRLFPFDPKSIASAMNLGKPVAAIKTPLSSGFDSISEVLCGGSSTRKSSHSLISRIIKSKA